MATELSDNYDIRPAQASDLDEVVRLLRPLVESRLLLRRTDEEVAGLLETGFTAVFREAAQSEVIAGFCAVEIYSKKLAEIQCLGVDPAHRSQGLGRLLVQRCVELAKDKGVMEVMAISSSETFLQDLGFDYSLPQQKRALFYPIRNRDEEI